MDPWQPTVTLAYIWSFLGRETSNVFVLIQRLLMTVYTKDGLFGGNSRASIIKSLPAELIMNVIMDVAK